jgi:hypothetical protein
MSILNLFGKKTANSPLRGVVDYGPQKKGKGGGHDHRCNKGDDRTPSQKAGDKKSGKANPD